jgi:hypothetical protein
MASDSLTEALDALEACLDALEEGADPDVAAAALAQPVKAFNASAKEALR